jgi:AraC-like DNA-binding protein/quercetin dioxygenase-like cupin family protein
MELSRRWPTEDAPFRLAVVHFRLGRGDHWPAEAHAEHQLSWVSSGTLAVEIAGWRWDVPPSQAIWIPAGVAHWVGAAKPSHLASLYLPPDTSAVTWTEPTLVEVTPLLAALIQALGEPALGPHARTAAEDLLLATLTPVERHALPLPMPVDPRARQLAEAFLAHPGDARDIGRWARDVAASPRHLRRLFVEETGLTVSEWRTRARMREAVALLGENVAVGAVAHAVGYRSASSFVTAFRRHFGQTPARFLDQTA